MFHMALAAGPCPHMALRPNIYTYRHCAHDIPAIWYSVVFTNGCSTIRADMHVHTQTDSHRDTDTDRQYRHRHKHRHS